MRAAIAFMLALSVVMPSGLLGQDSEQVNATIGTRELAISSASALYEQAVLLTNSGNHEGAEKAFREALNLRETWLGRDDPVTLLSIRSLALNLRLQGRYWDAEPLFARALARNERVLGKDHIDTLSSVRDLALCLKYQGRYSEAENLLLRALSTKERVLGREDSSTLSSAINLANLYKDLGRYGEAETLLRRVMRSRERKLGQDAPPTLASVRNLAALYLSQGRYPEAEALFVRFLEASDRNGVAHASRFLVISSLASLYKAQGRYGEAEPLYLEELRAGERLLGEDHPQTLAYLTNLAALFTDQGRYAEAEANLSRAMSSNVRVMGSDHPSTLASIDNLASLFNAQGRYEQAERLLLRALSGKNRVLGKRHPSTLSSLNSLASIYRAQGRFAEAEPLFQKVLEAKEQVLGKEHPSTLDSVSGLARLYSDQSRLSAALPLVWRALAGRISVLPDHHPAVATSFADMADLNDAQGGSPAKSNYFRKRAVNSLQGVRQNMAELDQETQRSFLNKHRTTYIELQQALIAQGRFAEAEQVGRMLKDVEYTAFVRGATDVSEGEQLALTRQESEWEAQFEAWLETPNQIANKLAALRSKERNEGKLSVLEQKQLADLDEAYGAAYEEFFTLVTNWTSETQTFDSNRIEREVEDLELEKSRAIQRLVGDIGADVALMQAVAFEDSLHLFFITGEAFVHEEVPVTRSELFQTIFAARSSIDKGRYLGSSTTDCRATLLGNIDQNSLQCSSGAAVSDARAEELQVPLGQLYRWLIAPIEDELAAAGTNTLMLNLQGQIRYIPFAALWDGNSYLTEKLQMAFYTPAANTQYDTVATLTEAQGFGLSNAFPGFSPLPGVPRELDYVIGTEAKPGILAGAYVLNEGFDRASFERELADPAPVVHIATHFHLKPGDEAASYLLLGDGSKVSVAAINRSYKFNFEGVELLTLSACETALGAESTGMEIEGFGALAQNKGAASVVASLWQVSDMAAPELMRSFYRGIVEDKLSKAAALQQAQVEMIRSKDFADPFNWAPFVIMGNWR
ncbi:CHAT domain-containing protein [Altererythrobacter ishigakiensis]|uniref:CHAT domain-containing protein n=2 Tax=Altererythrobacter ishigakiensis TaxID=476157 RepID=A0A562UW04_9SPHN|nr:CHAT domain-containing protein [Altererythrobacter ishigakiensis]